MRASRFATLCFLYNGGVALVGYLLSSPLQFDSQGVMRLSLAASFLFVGGYRLRSPGAETDSPPEYGWLLYLWVVVSVGWTAMMVVRPLWF